MTLMPVDPKAIQMFSKKHSHCKAMRAIEEFMRSDHKAVQLKYDTKEYAGVASVMSVYSRAVRRMNVDCVVMSRQGKVYLIKGGVFND